MSVEERKTRSVSREVRFVFTPDRSIMPDALWRSVLRYPPVIGSSKALPYHLDPGHAKVLAGLPRGSRVLEVGCGGGQMRRWLSGLGHVYVGTDISLTRVPDRLRVYGGPDLLGDAQFLPVKDGVFDVVYGTAVTQYFACPVLAFQDVFRALKPGGSFLSNVCFLEAWADDSFFHISPNGVIELLTAAGFEIEYVWPQKNYTVFHAAGYQAFRGPFRVLTLLSRFLAVSYGLQNRLRTFVRKCRGVPTEHGLLDAARISGAIFWIAHKPG